MAGGHRHPSDHHRLHVPADTPVHGLPASWKLAGLMLFAVAVALTPRRALPAFAIDAAVLLAALMVARLSPRVVLTRLTVVVPFLILATTVPFLAEGGERVELVGLTVPVDGLWGAWNIAAKACLGATASILVSATTPLPELVAGLGRLRLPAVVVAIVSFMFRYLDLLVDQLRRMRVAMVARCHDPRWLWQARPIAASAGALFVRSYERGERIHLAMAARGYTGAMPLLAERPRGRWHPAAAMAPGAVAAIGLSIAVIPR